MRYKNIKTGAIIDSPFNISGDNWEVLTHNQKGEVISGDEESPATEEYVEEEIDLAEMTNRELEQFAKEHEIPLLAEDKKNKNNLIKAITKAFEE